MDEGVGGPPDYRSNPEGFKKWCEHKRSEAWHKTHREEVLWEKDPLVCMSLAGCWIEIQYKQYHGNICDFKMDGIEKIRKSLLHDVIKKLDRVLWLYWVKWEWLTPFIIQVNERGEFILLMCKNKQGNMVSYDKAMHMGELKVVQRGCQ